jgi:hypothetical protein
MLHEEQKDEKCKKEHEEIQKRMEEAECQEVEECEADRVRKQERARCAKEARPMLLGRGISPVHSVKHPHVIPAFYIH